MKIKLKDGVMVREINTPCLNFCLVVSKLYKRHYVTPVITSANDGKHRADSLHYENLAWDLRIWGLKDPAMVAWELQLAFDKMEKGWEVVFGDKHHLDHFHVEFDIDNLRAGD